MSELEIKSFDEKNQETIIMLHHIQADLEKKKKKIQNSMQHYIIPNYLNKYGKQITIVSGVITLGASITTLQSLENIVLITGGVMGIVKTISSIILNPEKENLETLSLLDKQIQDCREEVDIRYQVEVYLSYGMILGTVGYYQKSLKHDWVENDKYLSFFIKQMITQLIQDEKLECSNPKQFEDLQKEREIYLENLFSEHPEKIYMLRRSPVS